MLTREEAKELFVKGYPITNAGWSAAEAIVKCGNIALLMEGSSTSVTGTYHKCPSQHVEDICFKASDGYRVVQFEVEL